jgi:4-diphosphocytidyl-2C-methyl-D-erythritol kinase
MAEEKHKENLDKPPLEMTLPDNYRKSNFSARALLFEDFEASNKNNSNMLQQPVADVSFKRKQSYNKPQNSHSLRYSGSGSGKIIFFCRTAFKNNIKF